MFKFNKRIVPLTAMLLAMLVSLPSAAETKFKRVLNQYIAALGERDATSGTGAQNWGYWEKDPGPRGVWLRNYPKLKQSGIAPAGWTFDPNKWWLEENGLIMEAPVFPLLPGKYKVTGYREVSSILTVYPKDSSGEQRWELADEATLYDVTHLACRSAVYTPETGASLCTPANANPANFRVTPGHPMPAVQGCTKKEYIVLVVTAIALDEAS